MINTREILKKYNLRAQKKYGQNFLTDEAVLEEIVDAAGITERDTVLEIGPGLGVLTSALAERAGRVIAVEIDKFLIPVLQENLREYDNIEIMLGDILRMDIARIVEDKRLEGGAVKVAANLPYYITTPIIMELLERRLPLDSITVMVQQEVGVRMQASPGGKEYGALSVAVQYYTEPELVLEVPPEAFIPRPDVKSCVMNMKILDRPSVDVKDQDTFFKVVRAAFGQRRKTLANALAGAPGLNVSKDQVTELLVNMGQNPLARGEILGLPEFAGIADSIYTLNQT